MSRLENVHKGRHDAPKRICLYSQRGLGKTSFGSEAPNPIFLLGEEGQGDIDDLHVMPTAKGRRVFDDWGDLRDALIELYKEPSGYKTIVIDTIDSLWPALFRYVCANYPVSKNAPKAETIEDYGYGKGYQFADDCLAKLLAFLDRLSEDRGFNIIILAHSTMKSIERPGKEPWLEYRIPGNDKLAQRVADWASDLLFMEYEIYVASPDGDRKKAHADLGDSGKRLIKTQVHPAYWAKNRHGLPAQMPMPEGQAYASYLHFCEAGRKNKAKLKAELAKKASKKAAPKTKTQPAQEAQPEKKENDNGTSKA